MLWLVPLLSSALSDATSTRQQRARLHELRGRLGLQAPRPQPSLRRRLWWALQQLADASEAPIGDQADWFVWAVGQLAGNPPTAGSSPMELERLERLEIDLSMYLPAPGERSPVIERMVPWLVKIELEEDAVTGVFGGGRAMAEHDDNVARLMFIADWFYATEPDIMSMTAGQALQAARQWHADQGSDPRIDAVRPGQVVHRFDDGWTVHELLERKALEEEGRYMGNCIGTYWPMVDAGTARVFSIRDPSGTPQADFEIRGGTLRQIEEARHRPASPDMRARAQPVLAEVGARVFEDTASWLRDADPLLSWTDGYRVIHLHGDMLPNVLQMLGNPFLPFGERPSLALLDPAGNIICMLSLTSSDRGGRGEPPYIMVTWPGQRTEPLYADDAKRAEHAIASLYWAACQLRATAHHAIRDGLKTACKAMENLTIPQTLTVPRDSLQRGFLRDARWTLTASTDHRFVGDYSLLTSDEHPEQHSRLRAISGEHTLQPATLRLRTADVPSAIVLYDVWGHPVVDRNGRHLITRMHGRHGRWARSNPYRAAAADLDERFADLIEPIGRAALKGLAKLPRKQQRPEGLQIPEDYTPAPRRVHDLPDAEEIELEVWRVEHPRDEQGMLRTARKRRLDTEHIASFEPAVQRALQLARSWGLPDWFVWVRLSGGSFQYGHTDPARATVVELTNNQVKIDRSLVFTTPEYRKGGHRYHPKLVSRIFVPAWHEIYKNPPQGVTLDGPWAIVEVQEWDEPAFASPADPEAAARQRAWRRAWPQVLRGRPPRIEHPQWGTTVVNRWRQRMYTPGNTRRVGPMTINTEWGWLVGMHYVPTVDWQDHWFIVHAGPYDSYVTAQNMVHAMEQAGWHPGLPRPQLDEPTRRFIIDDVIAVAPGWGAANDYCVFTGHPDEATEQDLHGQFYALHATPDRYLLGILWRADDAVFLRGCLEEDDWAVAPDRVFEPLFFDPLPSRQSAIASVQSLRNLVAEHFEGDPRRLDDDEAMYNLLEERSEQYHTTRDHEYEIVHAGWRHQIPQDVELDGGTRTLKAIPTPLGYELVVEWEGDQAWAGPFMERLNYPPMMSDRAANLLMQAIHDAGWTYEEGL